jgi:hypothetical protein
MTIALSESQRAAITAIKDWFENRTKDQQVFRCFGYAGAGKSTIVRYAMEEFSLSTSTSGSKVGDVLLCRVHRQSRAGDDSEGYARFDHPFADLSRLRGQSAGDRKAQGRGCRNQGQAAFARYSRKAV